MSNGAFISKQVAKTLIDKYQEDNPGHVKAYLYDANLVQELLDEPEVVSVRLYFGKTTDNKNCLVFVGVDANNHDLDNAKILEAGSPCPDNCDQSSYLET